MSNQKEKTTAQAAGMNRAKPYQLVLFPMNNGATNVYYILTMNFIAYYANGVLGLALMFATTMVTVMRLFDAVTDPIIGALIDRTNSKFGKFRPYMVIGNVIMIVSSILLYFGTRIIAPDMQWLRYACFVLFYALYVIGYTFQTACTRSGQTCLTNDPKQRPMFTIFNTIASLIGMGLVQFLAPILGDRLGGYNSANFFDFMIPLAIVVSAVLTLLAVIGIWEKDRPEFFGVGNKQEKVKLKEYVAILKANKELQRLMVAGAGCKLAFSIATNMTVLCMLYGAMMGDYGGLYLPMMIVGYIFSVPFFLLTVKTSQKHGQKASLVRYTMLALSYGRRSGMQARFLHCNEYDSTLYALRSNDGRLRRTVSSDDDRRIYFLCSVLPFDSKNITEAWTESFTGALYNACAGHVHWSFSIVTVMEAGGSGI